MTRPCPAWSSRSSPPRSATASLALRYFYSSLFVDLADLHGNTSDGVHVASTGGVWNALVYGFGGMRDHNGTITFDPRLPEDWDRLTFRITLRGHPAQGRRWCTSRSPSRSRRASRSRWRSVVTRSPSPAGEPVTVPLLGQGPQIDGEPALHSGERRQDGTLIIASVPQALSRRQRR